MDSLTIIQKELLAKGAEAVIYEGSFFQTPIILKHRLPKPYRLPEIDQTIRLHRLRVEARLLTEAWKNGARVPVLYGIDTGNFALLIEKIQGEILFSLMNSTKIPILKSIFEGIGEQVGLLHENDIIHGDLTVFNVIIKKENSSWFIDFGLGQISNELEKKADDLLTFYSTLKAISPNYKILFDEFQLGYIKVCKKGRKTFEHMKKIQSRARYIAREDRLE
ncbi:MAG: KEOPS complex kinase/ATPase Bud32 [Candidatus Thorarchaeota archaeon]